ncbi:hypothetical protein [uncultured Umboniibacter sp.]|uniref:hypothetical protein n=1 Tax=uncultured Umboniibacter sp. TaxID=1798917 RepID=UPI0026026CA8|nr:hypothetical protein [uncultured Umboniibacter sp.]
MKKLIAIAVIATLSTGCVFAVGTGGNSSNNCTITVNEDDSITMRGECPSSMRVNVKKPAQTIEIEEVSEVEVEMGEAE